MTLHTYDSDGVVETRLVHDVQRCATTLLVDAMAAADPEPEALARFRDFLVAALHHHHRAEDTDLWPLLLEVAPELAEPLAGLSAEHERLDAALDRLAGTDLGRGGPDAVATVAEVHDLVHGHLDREEPVLFPALQERLPAPTWDGFSQRTVAAAPQTGIEILAGLLHEVGDDRSVAVVLRHVPAEARALVPAMRAETRVVLDALGVAGRLPELVGALERGGG